MNARPGLDHVLALASGLLLLLAFPGTGGQGWLAFVALVPLLIAIRGASRRRAAALGLIAALPCWVVSVGWPAPTVIRLGGVAWARGALTAVVVVLVLAGFMALFAALLAGVPRRSAGGWVVAAASLWVALELARTPLFPWNLLGASQYLNVPLIQIAAIAGVYGVSFVVAAVNAALARVVLDRGARRPALEATAVAGLAVGLALASGWLTPAAPPDAEAIPIAVAQGNIDQAVKWDPRYRDATLAVYADLTRAAVADGARLVVWPETAVPLLARSDPHWSRVEALAREVGVPLLVGAPDRVGGQPRNSMFLLSADGALVARYDKRHLVPFAEYRPLGGAVGFLDVITGHPVSGFTPGTENVVMASPLGRLGPLICYEAIFPADVRAVVAAGAGVLVNVTNDAWFGRTATPVQHLAAATLRAVEHRVWLVRAANSGVSAIVAPDGRLVRASGLFTREVVVARVTARRQSTFYTRYGDIFAWSAAGVAIAAVWPLPARRRTRTSAEERALT